MVGGEGRDSGDQVWEAGEGLICEIVWDTDSHVAGGQVWIKYAVPFMQK